MVGTNKHWGPGELGSRGADSNKPLQHIPTHQSPPSLGSSQAPGVSCVNKGIIGLFYLLRLQTMGDLRRPGRQEIETQNI